MEIQLMNANGDAAGRTGILKKLVALRLEAGDVSIPVIVNGRIQKFDVAPVIRSRRTMIPVRAMAAIVGATVDWKADDPDRVILRKVLVHEEDEQQTVVFLLNLKTGIVTMNGMPIDFEVNPIVVSKRTMVPVRFIAEAFGMSVQYDPATKGVFIDSIIRYEDD
jgi:hypothetical protein